MFKAFCNVHFYMILYVMTYSTYSCLVTKLWIHGMYICMYVCMWRKWIHHWTLHLRQLNSARMLPPLYLWSVLILLCYRRLNLSPGTFISGFPTNILKSGLVPLMHASYPEHVTTPFGHHVRILEFVRRISDWATSKYEQGCHTAFDINIPLRLHKLLWSL
jgi:hypothetical protein